MARANVFGPRMFGVAAGGAIATERSGTLGRDLGADAGAGARWVRVDINWAQIQSGGASSFQWGAIDAVVRGAQARGMSVLGGIIYTPSWARPAGTPSTWGPSPGAFAAFAAAAVGHYAALGVHAYEVWNEPNTPSSWQPAPSPAAYTALLKAAYGAIKGADPSATVVTGGTAPAPSNGSSYSPVDFLRGIYANGGQGYFDAVGHHPYCSPAYPGDPEGWSAWYQMYGTSPSLRSVMIANGDGAKKIWATEFGAPTGGPASNAGVVTQAQQAAMLTRAYQLFSGYGWAGPLFFYQGRDQGTDTSNIEDFYGFLNHDFTPKPAYTAYQQAAASL
jgi:polysaccharide biosynthesis protein PslG